MEGIICPPYLEPMISQTLGIIQDAAIDACKRSSEMLRPCLMLHAIIKKCDLADGSIEYVAQYPDEYGVVAIGKTPEEAYLNFDKIWKGEPIESSDDDIVSISLKRSEWVELTNSIEYDREKLNGEGLPSEGSECVAFDKIVGAL